MQETNLCSIKQVLNKFIIRNLLFSPISKTTPFFIFQRLETALVSQSFIDFLGSLCCVIDMNNLIWSDMASDSQSEK